MLKKLDGLIVKQKSHFKELQNNSPPPHLLKYKIFHPFSIPPLKQVKIVGSPKG